MGVTAVKKERKPWGQILLLCPAETGSHRETSCYMCSPSFFMCSSSFFFAFIITIVVCNPIRLIWMTHSRPRMFLKPDEEVGEGFYHEFLDQISGLVFVSLSVIVFHKRFPIDFVFFRPNDTAVLIHSVMLPYLRCNCMQLQQLTELKAIHKTKATNNSNRILKCASHSHPLSKTSFTSFTYGDATTSKGVLVLMTVS